MAKTHVAFAAVAPRRYPRRDPDFVRRSGAIDGLKNKLEIEGKLEFANDDQRRFAVFERHEIAAAHLPFDHKTAVLEEAFDGKIESAFHSRTPADELLYCPRRALSQSGFLRRHASGGRGADRERGWRMAKARRSAPVKGPKWLGAGKRK